MIRLAGCTETGNETKCDGCYCDEYYDGVYTLKLYNATTKDKCTYVLKMHYYDDSKYIAVHDTIILGLKGNI